MKDDLQLSVIFCEDVRAEEGGKPIILGVLTPIGYVDFEEQEDNRLCLFSTITAPADVSEVNLELTLKTTPLGGETITKRLRKTLRPADEFEKGEPWVSWLPMRVKVPANTSGVRLRADLSANKRHAWASFILKPIEDDGEENN